MLLQQSAQSVAEQRGTIGDQGRDFGEFFDH